MCTLKKNVSDGEWGKYLYGKLRDYGITVLIGYEFLDQLSARFHVQLGLKNLAPDVDRAKADDTFKMQDSEYHLAISYNRQRISIVSAAPVNCNKF